MVNASKALPMKVNGRKGDGSAAGVVGRRHVLSLIEEFVSGNFTNFVLGWLYRDARSHIPRIAKGTAMVEARRGANLLGKLILAAGALTLVGGLIWVIVIRDRISAPSPEAISLEDNRGPTALAGPGSPPGKTFAVVGDDYALGDGAGWARGWVLRLGEQMCWRLGTTSMEPGTGFVAALQPGVTSYPQRLDGVDVSGADYILVEGGANDFLATSEDITAAADATFKALREKNPNAKIVAIGPLVVPRRAESGEYGRVSAAIATAAQQNGVLYVDPVAEQWLTDESLFFGVVPNSDGYVEFARRLKGDLDQAGLTASCEPAG